MQGGGRSAEIAGSPMHWTQHMEGCVESFAVLEVLPHMELHMMNDLKLQSWQWRFVDKLGYIYIYCSDKACCKNVLRIIFSFKTTCHERTLIGLCCENTEKNLVPHSPLMSKRSATVCVGFKRLGGFLSGHNGIKLTLCML